MPEHMEIDHSVLDIGHSPLLADISRIDTRDDTYRITTWQDIDPLAASIEYVGLLNPPLLQQKENTFRIISGFRRVEAFKKLNFDRIPTRLLDASLSDRKIAVIAIGDNTCQRTLNLVEVSRSLNLLDRCSKTPAAAREAAIPLGLPSNPSVINKLKKICQLPISTQQGVCDGLISLKNALELDTMDPATTEALSRMFKDLHVSQSKQREIITHLKEVALRENTSPQTLLDQTELKTIIDHPDLDRTQKTNQIRTFLKTRRYPNLTRSEDRFRKNVGKLHVGEQIVLTPPANFETGEYVFNIRFKTVSELESRLKTLQTSLDSPHLKKILDR